MKSKYLIITRRDFIKGAAAFILTARGMRFFETKRYVEESIDIMGTQARISVFHDDKEEAKEGISAAFRELRRVDLLMSNFKVTSDIYRINSQGFLLGASEETINVIRRANYYSELTGGAFDISIQSLVESGGILNVGYKDIWIHNRDVKLKPGMKITLGGIGIGHAVDRATEVLKQSGIQHALVNIGGDIKALGGKGDLIAWRVGIKDPRRNERYLAIVDLEDSSLATSGNYERSHILNPKTGKLPEGIESVTVITRDCIDADVLSTAVFVLGPEKGLELIRKLNAECIMVTKDGILKVEDSGAGMPSRIRYTLY
jgi:thiamine biosynthesis lipoprotein